MYMLSVKHAGLHAGDASWINLTRIWPACTDMYEVICTHKPGLTNAGHVCACTDMYEITCSREPGLANAGQV